MQGVSEWAGGVLSATHLLPLSALCALIRMCQHVDYLIQDDSDLRSSMSALVRDVAGVLHVPSHLASMLLRSHNWNKEKFMTRYFEDTERLLREHGLQHMEEDGETGACKDDCAPSAAATTLAADNSATAAASNAGETVNCSVCYDDYAIEETTALGCGHRSVAETTDGGREDEGVVVVGD